MLCVHSPPTQSTKLCWHSNSAGIQIQVLLTQHLKLDPARIELERSHRTGRFDGDGRPRTVVVKLLRFKDKEEILKRANKLKGTNLYINEDFSDKVRQKRKDLLPRMIEARNQGNYAYLRYDQLVVRPPRSPRPARPTPAATSDTTTPAENVED